MGQRIDRVKAFFFATEFPSGDQRPSRLWEVTHPRQAEAFWARLEAEDEMLVDEGNRQLIEEEQSDADYWNWMENYPHSGNPSKSRALDREIDRYSEEYPEVSSLEREQEEFYRQAYERGPNWSYPEYEGPGFTEPPLNWSGYAHKDWTFTQWAKERDYVPERIAEINDEFPPDRAELYYARSET